MINTDQTEFVQLERLAENIYHLLEELGLQIGSVFEITGYKCICSSVHLVITSSEPVLPMKITEPSIPSSVQVQLANIKKKILQ